MKKTLMAVLATLTFTSGAAFADPEGVNGELVGLEGAPKFVNVWNNDDIEDADFDLVYKHGNIKTASEIAATAKGAQ